jgi:hypothetical protein
MMGMDYGNKFERLRRRVIGIVVSYAVAIQTLFVGFAGLPLPASADETSPAFELCHGLNGVQDKSGSPGGALGHVGGSHCIFCYAGSHLALGAPPSRLYHRVDVQIRTVDWTLNTRRLSFSHNYLIAEPRGPPPSA